MASNDLQAWAMMGATGYANIGGLGTGSYSGSIGQAFGQLIGGYADQLQPAQFDHVWAQQQAMVSLNALQKPPEAQKAKTPADPEADWLKSRVKEIEWRP